MIRALFIQVNLPLSFLWFSSSELPHLDNIGMPDSISRDLSHLLTWQTSTLLFSYFSLASFTAWDWYDHPQSAQNRLFAPSMSNLFSTSPWWHLHPSHWISPILLHIQLLHWEGSGELWWGASLNMQHCCHQHSSGTHEPGTFSSLTGKVGLVCSVHAGGLVSWLSTSISTWQVHNVPHMLDMGTTATGWARIWIPVTEGIDNQTASIPLVMLQRFLWWWLKRTMDFVRMVSQISTTLCCFSGLLCPLLF